MSVDRLLSRGGLLEELEGGSPEEGSLPEAWGRGVHLMRGGDISLWPWALFVKMICP